MAEARRIGDSDVFLTQLRAFCSRPKKYENKEMFYDEDVSQKNSRSFNSRSYKRKLFGMKGSLIHGQRVLSGLLRHMVHTECMKRHTSLRRLQDLIRAFGAW